MNSTPQPVLPSFGQNWRMLRTMAGIGTICGLIIVSIFQVTKPVIAHNKAIALQKAVFAVLENASRKITYQYNDAGEFKIVSEGAAPDDKLPQLHVAYNQANELVGFAITGSGMGFQDTIELIYGYAPELNAIVGYQVLTSRETPGLGTRIETDEVFLENFKRLDVSLNTGQDALAHAIEAVKPGRKTQPWQIDTITGATISSIAVADILQNSASHWVPLISKHMQVFKDGNKT